MSCKFPPETYTASEEKRLAEFRTRISDLELRKELHDSANLIRWLRARNLDVNKAYEMLKTSLEWRKTNGIDGILETEQLPEDFIKMTPVGFVGYDKEGYPIYLAPAGRRDARAMLEKWGLEKSLRYQIIFNEMLMTGLLQKHSEEQGRPISAMVQFIDLEGFKYGQFLSKFCREFFQSQRTWNDNYPETLRYCLAVNAPKAFHIVWNMMKPFMPKATLEKMDIYGTDKEKWMKVVKEKFPLEGIPLHWGGNRPGKDEFCSDDETFWIYGALEPSFFHFDKPFLMDGDDDSANLSQATINSRDSLKIKLSVTTIDSFIAWRFRVDSHDIGFQILDQDENELVKYKKINASKQFEEGQEKCDKLGIYTVVFDNSYSWTRSKIVHHQVSVISVGEDLSANAD